VDPHAVPFSPVGKLAEKRFSQPGLWFRANEHVVPTLPFWSNKSNSIRPTHKAGFEGQPEKGASHEKKQKGDKTTLSNTSIKKALAPTRLTSVNQSAAFNTQLL